MKLLNSNMKRRIKLNIRYFQGCYFQKRYQIIESIGDNYQEKQKYLHYMQKELNNNIKVNLKQINGYIWVKGHEDYKKRFILNGDWDLGKYSIEDYKYNLEATSYKFKTVEDIFINKVNFKKTEEYKHHIDRLLKNGKTRDGIKTEKELDEYFEKMINLFHSIKRNGVLAQKEIGYLEEDGIGCVIDRNGNLLKSHNGHHRFLIASILGIEKIPVHILGVSKEWVEQKLNVKENKDPLILKINKEMQLYELD